MSADMLWDDSVPMVHPVGDTARARRSDPVTSHEAADSNDVNASQEFVEYLLRTYGAMADFELAGRAAIFYRGHPDSTVYSESRIRSARHELAEAGTVEFTGGYTYRPFPAKQIRHQVWQVSE